MKTRVIAAFAVLTVAALMVATAGPAAASDHRAPAGTPPPDRVVIDLVTVNGNGCPPGTVPLTVLPDNTGFVVELVNFIVKVGGDARPIDARRNCQLNIYVHPPAGYEYAIDLVDYHGWGAMAPGTLATLRTDLRYSGSQTTITKRFPGPFDDAWVTRDVLPELDLMWSSCTMVRPLSIGILLTAQRSLASPNVTSYFELGPRAQFGLAWRTCP
jgi:hypothetical protein